VALVSFSSVNLKDIKRAVSKILLVFLPKLLVVDH
jgi:hypothetical protein